MQNIARKDPFKHVASYLTMEDLSKTREVDRSWRDDGRKRVTLYKIGLDKNGSSKWDSDPVESYGWGMKIAVNEMGDITGTNKNNNEHAGTAREKTYSGKLEHGLFRVNVVFKDTGQLNYYEGRIVEENGQKMFRGRFTMNHTAGERPVGAGGTLWGIVQEA